MKATDDDLREALGLGRPRGTAERAACPKAEELATQAEGGGDAATRSRVLEHVAQCAQCAFEQRLAASLQPWADGAAFAVSPSAAPARRVAPRSAWWPAALAASLLLSAGLGSWSVALRQRGHELQAQLGSAEQRERESARRLEAADSALHAARVQEPVPNVPIVDLEAAGGRGASVHETTVRLAPGATWVTFVLSVAGVAQGEAHALEIKDAQERVLWRGDGLRPNGFGSFTVAVPQALLPPGRYEFRLARAEVGGDAHVVGAYRVVVAPDQP